MSDYPVTAQTRLRRMPERGQYDQATVHAILDAGTVAHVGVLIDGAPVVIPTAYWRVGEDVLVHAARATRFARALRSGQRVSLTVTLLDGWVLARSGFNHSVNYRSVMLFAVPEEVEDAESKNRLLDALIERIVPGRAALVRPATAKELAATAVFRLPLAEVSAKLRSGPPKDDEADLDWPVWAGVIPLALTAAAAQPDPRQTAGLPGRPPL